MKQNQPYEKFISHGPRSLTDSELIAIMLRTGTRDKSALALAGEVLQAGNYSKKGILGLYDLSLKELCQIKGIGMVKAVKLRCIFHPITRSEGFINIDKYRSIHSRKGYDFYHICLLKKIGRQVSCQKSYHRFFNY